MLGDLLNEEEKKRKAARRGRILIWWILGPAAIIFLAFRVWQLLTGKV
jgi:hypothetical protein